jgi:hypothetical protein
MDFPRRVSRRLAALCFALLALSVVLVAAPPAEAASLKINQAGIKRSVPFRRDPVTRYWINRSECLLNDVLTFPLIIADYAGTELEVWVGEGTGDCKAREARTSISATCWRVWRGVPGTNVPTVEIPVQNIAAKKKPPEHDISIGGPEDCNASVTAAQSITLYFMLIYSLDNQAGETWSTSLDLLGPSAPADFAVGSGSSFLRATWAANTDTDVAGYRFFCDPPAGYAPDADNTFGPGTGPQTSTGGSTAMCPDASTDDPDAEVGDASTCSADAGGGSGGNGGSGGAVGPCGTITALARDLVPTPDFNAKYECGAATGKGVTNSLIRGLTNWQPTNVAIAGVDASGNAGPLSDVVCGVAEPVNGFDYVYRESGGSAGDGFCSLRYPMNGKGFPLIGAELLALAWFVRRRLAKARLGA